MTHLWTITSKIFKMKNLILIATVSLLFFLNGYSQINLVKDIFPGTNNSSPTMLTDVNGTLYFDASPSNVLSYDLWKSDGTVAGTSIVKNLPVNSYGALLSFNNILYFFDPAGNLWKSDGTETGTSIVKLFLTNSIITPIIYGNKFYFFQTTLAGSGMYKSDGTAAGTTFVSDKINTSYLKVSGTTMFSTGSDTTNGNELWKTDGTTAGTVLVKNINTTIVNAGNSNPSFLTDVNGVLYFMANDGVNGNELWKSDGTDAGTVMVKNIGTGAASISTESMTNVNGVLYFTINQFDLWKSDGTAAGTVKVKGFGTIQNLVNVNGTLFFAATDDVYANANAYGFELWKSDGTLAGTTMIKDINPGPTGSGMQEPLAVGGTLYFSALNTANGRELWKSDGTESGTTLIQDRNLGNVFFSPKKLTLCGNKLFMTGSTATEGLELFVYDINTLKIKENNLADNFKIYPNPSNGNFNIEVTENLIDSKATVYNLLGQKIKGFDLKTTTTNQYLNKGIYLLEIENEGIKTTKKLIVN